MAECTDSVWTIVVLVRQTEAQDEQRGHSQGIEHPKKERHEVDESQDVARHDKRAGYARLKNTHVYSVYHTVVGKLFLPAMLGAGNEVTLL